jgi:hypothetical protein
MKNPTRSSPQILSVRPDLVGYLLQDVWADLAQNFWRHKEYMAIGFRQKKTFRQTALLSAEGKKKERKSTFNIKWSKRCKERSTLCQKVFKKIVKKLPKSCQKVIKKVVKKSNLLMPLGQNHFFKKK